MKKMGLLALLLILSCNREEKITKIGTKSDAFNELYSEGYLDSLYLKINKEGDTLAYEKAISLIRDYGVPKNLSLNTYRMAHQYDYAPAYYNVFLSYRFMCPSDDIQCQQIGIYYLLKAHEKKYKELESDLEEIFGNNKIPYSEDYLKERDSTKIYRIPIY